MCLTGSLAKCFIVVFTVHCSPLFAVPEDEEGNGIDLGVERGKYHLHAVRFARQVRERERENTNI